MRRTGNSVKQQVALVIATGAAVVAGVSGLLAPAATSAIAAPAAGPTIAATTPDGPTDIKDWA
ncbi:hypothetical protein [Kitasatospora azatica]|uniref:hypothetical protein n=1 Tax=Kitasatospora azatica TaxID=58347 RepID=UPI0005651ED1|nr:hypothetical protein [Kitasatospora azatica]